MPHIGLDRQENEVTSPTARQVASHPEPETRVPETIANGRSTAAATDRRRTTHRARPHIPARAALRHSRRGQRRIRIRPRPGTRSFHPFGFVRPVPRVFSGHDIHIEHPAWSQHAKHLRQHRHRLGEVLQKAPDMTMSTVPSRNGRASVVPWVILMVTSKAAAVRSATRSAAADSSTATRRSAGDVRPTRASRRAEPHPISATMPSRGA